MSRILCYVALLAPLSLGPGCGPPEPVLPGVVQESHTALASPGERHRPGYEKPPGILVDVKFLCGRTLSEVRDQLSIQMGDIQQIIDLDPRDGRELVLERGSVRVKGDTIYMVRVQLEGPLRRSPALQAVGLPVTVRRWNSFTHEFSTRHHAGYARIRMGRLEPESEAVTWVEVMKDNPRR